MKHVFVINSTAGITDKTQKVEDEIRKLLSEDEFVIIRTKKEGDAENFLQDILQNSDDKYRIYACGGDGTLNVVVNACVGYDVEIANYPIGSGNDFLRYFDNFNDFYDLEKLINGKVINSDLIKINGKYSINIFNLGFDGKVVAYQRKLKRLPFVGEKSSYKLGVFLCAFGKLNNYMKLSVDGEVVYRGKGILCAFANGTCYGGGFYCAPIAKIDDGQIDVCLIKKIGLIAFSRFVKTYKKGKHLDDDRLKKYVLYKKGKCMELEIEKKVYCSFDGELEKFDKVVLNIIPSAVKFVVPK